MTDPINKGQDQVSAEMMLDKDGNPFATAKQAKQSMAGKDLDFDKYTVALFGKKPEDGWVIIPRKPIQSEVPEGETGKANLDLKGAVEQEERKPRQAVLTTGVIAPKVEAPKSDDVVSEAIPAIVAPTAPEMPKLNIIDPTEVKGGYDDDGEILPEKYFWVRFDPKSHANDQERVMLGVNGEILTIDREVNVILPGRFIEVAEHSVVQKFKQEPGKERKTLGETRTWPFRITGTATEEEYLRMKAIGDASEKASRLQAAS